MPRPCRDVGTISNQAHQTSKALASTTINGHHGRRHTPPNRCPSFPPSAACAPHRRRTQIKLLIYTPFWGHVVVRPRSI